MLGNMARKELSTYNRGVTYDNIHKLFYLVYQLNTACLLLACDYSVIHGGEIKG